MRRSHFLALHEQRVTVYKYFDTKFKEYLDSGYEQVYKGHVMAITRQFQDISENVKKLQEGIEKDDAEGSNVIQQIQMNEKEKLRVTIEIQMIKKKYRADKKKQEMIQNEIELKYDRDLIEKKREMDEIVQKINDLIMELSVE